MHIGICDDHAEVRNLILQLCEKYFKDSDKEHFYLEFSSGEEVLKYCENKDNFRIDLLLLDIEMDGISGIELKDKAIKQDLILRIAFVSSHTEDIFDAYGTKTIGFIPKPPVYNNIKKVLDITIDELRENVVITISGYKGDIIEIKLDDILYLKADGSCTEIYTYNSILNDTYILSTKKLGEIENELSEFSIIRVHKSYLVNIANVLEINSQVILRDNLVQIPIGRRYKENTKRKFYQFGKNRIRKRL